MKTLEQIDAEFDKQGKIILEAQQEQLRLQGEYRAIEAILKEEKKETKKK